MELFSEKIFNKSKGKTLLPYICDICGKYDVRTKRGFQYGYKNGTKHQCCSKKCGNSAILITRNQSGLQDVTCGECGEIFKKYPNQIKRSKHNFCSNVCSARFNNRLRIKYYQCIECNNVFKRTHKKQKYCSSKCQQKYQSNLLLEKWKRGEDCGWVGKTIQLKTFIRRYIRKKYNHKCSKCGWDEKHPITGNVPVEINHIDGNAKNCKEDNLELLCPNCHSLTYNFRALNKNSQRIRK